MNAFDLLHPVLKHHIINTLNWRRLMPLQESCIQSIISGEHTLMIAPTAGGKTEASLFPLLSRMLFENWIGLSLIYICPIKALLNNLHERLTKYTMMAGRRSDIWHGDTSASKRNKILSDPPDCLLTTPESIEAMLISKRSDNNLLFENLQAIIIDEIHAFAGDDRGWHLLSILERLTIVAGREIQRVGLSATVGNPEKLLNWLSGHCNGKSRLFCEKVNNDSEVDVKLDYVGNLENAALLISNLYKGKKRLVFCDSRARVERLSSILNQKDIKNFVCHSSLSKEIREQSEKAFQNEKDCVIVSTSVLELGIDVGDLDYVIQIDSPSTVSAFLQRLGRTGRRNGTTRNCLFLATTDNSFLQSAALLELWSSGYVEPILPPPCPYHVFVQQILGLILQENGIGRNLWKKWIGRIPSFKTIPDELVSSIFKYMIENKILAYDQGLIWLGDYGEKIFGFRNYMNICSVFTSSPLIAVKHMKSIIGYVDAITFVGNKEQNILSLGGNSWFVYKLDWDKRIAFVKPTDLKGASIWMGTGQFLSYDFCMTIKKILATNTISKIWSKRSLKKINELRNSYDWLEMDSTAMTCYNDSYYWWTFAGKTINIILASIIEDKTGIKSSCDNFKIKMNKYFKKKYQIKLNRSYLNEIVACTFKENISQYKFNECLPDKVFQDMIQKRFDSFNNVKKQFELKTININY